MLASLLVSAMVDKVAARSQAEIKRKRHEYYIRNRTQLQARNRQYRTRNKAGISRKQKIYRRQVSTGTRRTRHRISSGQSYTYGGYR